MSDTFSKNIESIKEENKAEDKKIRHTYRLYQSWKKTLRQAKQDLIDYQTDIDDHLLSLKGTEKLGMIFSGSNDVMRRLGMEHIPIYYPEDVFTHGGLHSNLRTELGNDLAVRELGKFSDAKTAKQKALITKLRHYVQQRPSQVFTYVNTWKVSAQGKRVQLKFAVHQTSPILVETFIYREIAGIDNTIDRLNHTLSLF